MNKKLIKKCLPGDVIVKSDNTRVASPVIEEKSIYIQPLSKQTYVSADYRSPWLQQQALKKADIAYNMYMDERNKELALQHALGLAAVADVFMLVPDATDLITKGIRYAGKKYLLRKNAKLVSSLLDGTPTVTPIANNVGWGPRYTGQVVHKSKSSNPLVLHNPKRWDVVNEGANPHGVWYLGEWGVPRTVANATEEKAEKAARARAIFEERPYAHEGELVLEKPIITVGEVPDRSALSYQADALGADGLIYNNVYDNGYNNNQVILSFKKHTPQALVKWYGPTSGKSKERTGAIVFRGNSNSKYHNPDFPYYFTTDPKYAANYGKVDAYILDVTLEVPAKYPFINDNAISVDMNFGLSNQNFNYSQPVLKGNDLVTYEMEPSQGIEYSTYFPKLLNLLYKIGGKLIPKHAKGNPVNTNPLPEIPVNTKPVPKKEDKKNKLFEIDLRTIGNTPPLYLTYPNVDGKGLYMIKRKK